MPKDEFDFEDPFELNGMVVQSRDDTTREMAETFVEEFMRMGYSHKQILALFHNPHYLGPNLALQKHGEPFLRDLIAEVFARWGRQADWPVATGILAPIEPGFQPGGTGMDSKEPLKSPDNLAPADVNPGARMPAATDPTGAPIPEYTV